MFGKILTFLAQEPPTPTPPSSPAFGPSPALYIFIAIVIAALIAWKYKAILEFIIVLCSTIAGFIIGFVSTPPYGNVGLGMMGAIAGLVISIAIVALVRLIKAQ